MTTIGKSSLVNHGSISRTLRVKVQCLSVFWNNYSWNYFLRIIIIPVWRSTKIITITSSTLYRNDVPLWEDEISWKDSFCLPLSMRILLFECVMEIDWRLFLAYGLMRGRMESINILDNSIDSLCRNLLWDNLFTYGLYSRWRTTKMLSMKIKEL